MKPLRIVYGFNPFNISTQIITAHVIIIGVTGEWKYLSHVDNTDLDNRGTSWRNDCLTCARKAAEKEAKFYGVKPERMEHNKVVPRSFNYSAFIGK